EPEQRQVDAEGEPANQDDPVRRQERERKVTRGHRREAERHACPRGNRPATGHQQDAERRGEERNHPEERGDAKVERSRSAHQVDDLETTGLLVPERLDLEESEQLEVPDALRGQKGWWGMRGWDHPARRMTGRRNN